MAIKAGNALTYTINSISKCSLLKEMSVVCVIVLCINPYLAFTDPDSFILLFSYGILETSIPGIMGRVQINGSWTKKPHLDI